MDIKNQRKIDEISGKRDFLAKISIKAASKFSATPLLIKISAEGPPVVDYDPAPAVAAWFSSAKKPRRPFYTP